MAGMQVVGEGRGASGLRERAGSKEQMIETKKRQYNPNEELLNAYMIGAGQWPLLSAMWWCLARFYEK
jgi:hypothetical protein